MKKQNIKKKPVHGNVMIEQLMQRQNLIESGKKAEKEVTEKTKEIQPEGEKNLKDEKEIVEESILNEDTIEDKTKNKDADYLYEDYENFFKINEKFEGDKDASVYIYSRLHYKLKSIVTAEARKNVNMTVLLSNIVDDFFLRYDKKIKKSLKKMTDI